jgi:hypothetical protein
MPSLRRSSTDRTDVETASRRKSFNDIRFTNEDIKAEIPIGGAFFPYSQLEGRCNITNINHAFRELYLSDLEFIKLFSETKADFLRLPKWKQISMKKRLRLF